MHLLDELMMAENLSAEKKNNRRKAMDLPLPPFVTKGPSQPVEVPSSFKEAKGKGRDNDRTTHHRAKTMHNKAKHKYYSTQLDKNRKKNEDQKYLVQPMSLEPHKNASRVHVNRFESRDPRHEKMDKIDSSSVPYNLNPVAEKKNSLDLKRKLERLFENKTKEDCDDDDDSNQKPYVSKKRTGVDSYFGDETAMKKTLPKSLKTRNAVVQDRIQCMEKKVPSLVVQNEGCSKNMKLIHKEAELAISYDTESKCCTVKKPADDGGVKDVLTPPTNVSSGVNTNTHCQSVSTKSNPVELIEKQTNVAYIRPLDVSCKETSDPHVIAAINHVCNDPVNIEKMMSAVKGKCSNRFNSKCHFKRDSVKLTKIAYVKPMDTIDTMITCSRNSEDCNSSFAVSETKLECKQLEEAISDTLHETILKNHKTGLSKVQNMEKKLLSTTELGAQKEQITDMSLNYSPWGHLKLLAVVKQTEVLQANSPQINDSNRSDASHMNSSLASSPIHSANLHLASSEPSVSCRDLPSQINTKQTIKKAIISTQKSRAIELVYSKYKETETGKITEEIEQKIDKYGKMNNDDNTTIFPNSFAESNYGRLLIAYSKMMKSKKAGSNIGIKKTECNRGSSEETKNNSFISNMRCKFSEKQHSSAEQQILQLGTSIVLSGENLINRNSDYIVCNDFQKSSCIQKTYENQQISNVNQSNALHHSELSSEEVDENTKIAKFLLNAMEFQGSEKIALNQPKFMQHEKNYEHNSVKIDQPLLQMNIVNIPSDQNHAALNEHGPTNANISLSVLINKEPHSSFVDSSLMSNEGAYAMNKKELSKSIPDNDNTICISSDDSDDVMITDSPPKKEYTVIDLCSEIETDESADTFHSERVTSVRNFEVSDFNNAANRGEDTNQRCKNNFTFAMNCESTSDLLFTKNCRNLKNPNDEHEGNTTQTTELHKAGDLRLKEVNTEPDGILCKEDKQDDSVDLVIQFATKGTSNSSAHIKNVDIFNTHMQNSSIEVTQMQACNNMKNESFNLRESVRLTNKSQMETEIRDQNADALRKTKCHVEKLHGVITISKTLEGGQNNKRAKMEIIGSQQSDLVSFAESEPNEPLNETTGTKESILYEEFMTTCNTNSSASLNLEMNNDYLETNTLTFGCNKKYHIEQNCDPSSNKYECSVPVQKRPVNMGNNVHISEESISNSGISLCSRPMSNIKNDFDDCAQQFGFVIENVKSLSNCYVYKNCQNEVEKCSAAHSSSDVALTVTEKVDEFSSSNISCTLPNKSYNIPCDRKVNYQLKKECVEMAEILDVKQNHKWNEEERHSANLNGSSKSQEVETIKCAIQLDMLDLQKTLKNLNEQVQVYELSKVAETLDDNLETLMEKVKTIKQSLKTVAGNSYTPCAKILDPCCDTLHENESFESETSHAERNNPYFVSQDRLATIDNGVSNVCEKKPKDQDNVDHLLQLSTSAKVVDSVEQKSERQDCEKSLACDSGNPSHGTKFSESCSGTIPLIENCSLTDFSYNLSTWRDLNKQNLSTERAPIQQVVQTNNQTRFTQLEKMQDLTSYSPPNNNNHQGFMQLLQSCETDSTTTEDTVTMHEHSSNMIDTISLSTEYDNRKEGHSRNPCDKYALENCKTLGNTESSSISTGQDLINRTESYQNNTSTDNTSFEFKVSLKELVPSISHNTFKNEKEQVSFIRGMEDLETSIDELLKCNTMKIYKEDTAPLSPLTMRLNEVIGTDGAMLMKYTMNSTLSEGSSKQYFTEKEMQKYAAVSPETRDNNNYSTDEYVLTDLLSPIFSKDTSETISNDKPDRSTRMANKLFGKSKAKVKQLMYEKSKNYDPVHNRSTPLGPNATLLKAGPINSEQTVTSVDKTSTCSQYLTTEKLTEGNDRLAIKSVLRQNNRPNTSTKVGRPPFPLSNNQSAVCSFKSPPPYNVAINQNQTLNPGMHDSDMSKNQQGLIYPILHRMLHQSHSVKDAQQPIWSNMNRLPIAQTGNFSPTHFANVQRNAAQNYINHPIPLKYSKATGQCAVCSTPAYTLCRGCASVAYCSESCAMFNWKFWHHKECLRLSH